MTRVAIFGMGYVGCVSAACLARNGHPVIGVDITPSKLEALRAGQPPLSEAGLDVIIRQTVDDGTFRVTDSAAEAVAACDVSLICVGTPSRDSGELTSEHLVRVCEDIGGALRDRPKGHVVCIRSTMLPGTLNGTVIPALEATSGLKSGTDFHVAVNPEFLREGSAISDFDHPPKIVIGTSSESAARVIQDLYAGIDAPTFVVPPEVAELTKCVDNAWHATKVTFANEVGALCRAAGIDSHAVMDVFKADRQLNISTTYLTPGFAFGGSCLPKELRALGYYARHADVDLPLLQHVLPSNTRQIERTVARVAASGIRRVGLFGLSFKTGTDDLRESPMVRMAEMLLGKGFQLRIYDANLDPSKFVGANKTYIEQRLPHLSALLTERPDTLLENAEMIIIAHRTEASEAWAAGIPDNLPVLDLVRLNAAKGHANFEGLYW